MSGCYQRQSLELQAKHSPSISVELNRTNTTASCNPNQRRRQQRASLHRQESWFRHSMPPAINRDFESLEHLQTQDTGNGLDEQLAASLSGKLPVLSHTSIHLNSANSNLGFIDSDTPNTPITPPSSSVAGTLSSCQPPAEPGSRHRSSRNRKDSRASILSNAARGLRMTTSFLRRKRKEYEGE